MKLVLALMFLGSTTSCSRAPSAKDTPKIVPQLKRLRQICESSAKSLAQKGRGGRRNYEKVEAAVNSCIVYLASALHVGDDDEAYIWHEMRNVDKEANEFLTWTDEQLRTRRSEGSPQTAAVCANATLNFIRNENQAQRDALAGELKKCSFRPWNDVIKEGAASSTESQ